jgi:hypothetical protein
MAIKGTRVFVLWQTLLLKKFIAYTCIAASITFVHNTILSSILVKMYLYLIIFEVTLLFRNFNRLCHYKTNTTTKQTSMTRTHQCLSK